jgi:AmmeMemoRadiSam system protein B
MNLRESVLPSGWYPRDPGEISRFLSGEEISPQGVPSVSGARAAIAPHAGWHYSGKIAAQATAALDRTVDTLVIIGGHLPAGYPPLFALEDAVSTPLGAMPIHTALRSTVLTAIGGQEDRFPDNTIEVLLPMARFFYPAASLLWLRLPAELSSFESGKMLAQTASSLGCTVAVLASTDLTHYGPSYHFTSQGTGPQALRWMKETNDRRFIDAVISGDPSSVLERAEKDQSSCSAGAVLGAMGFASALNFKPARLLEYGTSADANPSADSFVGYAAMTFAG